MTESNLKIILNLLQIDIELFNKFMAHKTVSVFNNETFFYMHDIEYFLFTYLQEHIH